MFSINCLFTKLNETMLSYCKSGLFNCCILLKLNILLNKIDQLMVKSLIFLIGNYAKVDCLNIISIIIGNII